jgi:hypothetical protein
MMRQILLLAPVLALAGCSLIAAEGNEWKDAKAIAAGDNVIAAFQKLEVAGSDDVTFVTGEGFHIQATGDADTLKKLRYRVENGVLMIGREGENWQWNSSDKGAKITVTAPLLSSVSLAGSGDLTADQLQGDDVKIELAGSGNVTIKAVTAKTISGEIAGSGNVDLAGKVASGDYEIAGSGDINAKNLAHSDAKVSIAGSGDIALTATGTVNADIAGSGSVDVMGGAKCTSSTTGSGKLNCS